MAAPSLWLPVLIEVSIFLAALAVSSFCHTVDHSHTVLATQVIREVVEVAGLHRHAPSPSVAPLGDLRLVGLDEVAQGEVLGQIPQKREQKSL